MSRAVLLGALGATAVLVWLSRRKQYLVPSSAEMLSLGPQQRPLPPFSMQPLAATSSRLDALRVRERALWNEEIGLRDDANSIARSYRPGWQRAVGALQSRANEIAQQRADIGYQIEMIRQGRM